MLGLELYRMEYIPEGQGQCKWVEVVNEAMNSGESEC